MQCNSKMDAILTSVSGAWRVQSARELSCAGGGGPRVYKGRASGTEPPMICADGRKPAMIFRRDSDSDSDGDGAGSGNSGKCEGSKQQCELPTDHNLGVRVGVAVAIPVGVIIIVLVGILIVVYRRSKREEKEDHDPEFEGDNEYIPVARHGALQKHRENMMMATDPFQLPGSTGSDADLRDFAKRVQSDGFGGYQLASMSASNNASQVSLTHLDQSRGSAGPRMLMKNMRPPMTHMAYSSTSLRNATNGHSTDDSTGTSTDRSPTALSADEKLSHNLHSNLSEKPKPSFEFETMVIESNDLDDDDDDDDDEYNNGRTNERNNYHRDTDKYDMEDDNASEFVTELSPDEEENIQRMKSIYKVYLDRSKTIKEREDNPLPSDDEQESLALKREENEDTLNALTTSNNQLAVQEGSNHGRAASSIYSELPVLSQHEKKVSEVSNQMQMNDRNVVPPQTSQDITGGQQYGQPYNTGLDGATQAYPYQSQEGYNQFPQEAYYQQSSQNGLYGQQIPEEGNYPQSQYIQYPQQMYQPTYNVSLQQNMMSYNNNNASQEFHHPQTLETIGELPTPAYLASSESTNSLTAFKKNQKQQLHQIQTARINGTALNPMDHPEMFYSPSTDTYLNNGGMQPSNGSVYSANTYRGQVNGAPLPYQLRQSVVMTNPSELSLNTLHKPAGSLRNYINSNSRNNSLTTQGNPYNQPNQSRVSGILDHIDTIQPPGVGNILPHNGSSSDLRKQLGSSNNYNFS